MGVNFDHIFWTISRLGGVAGGAFVLESCAFLNWFTYLRCLLERDVIMLMMYDIAISIGYFVVVKNPNHRKPNHPATKKVLTVNVFGSNPLESFSIMMRRNFNPFIQYSSHSQSVRFLFQQSIYNFDSVKYILYNVMKETTITAVFT